MIVYQFDHAGILIGQIEADPSPLEPGKFLIPARCTVVPPPAEVPEGEIPRWNGAAWVLVRIPAREAPEDPVAKLQQFLAANPDVAALINPNG
jgi:hypothetical protein